MKFMRSSKERNYCVEKNLFPFAGRKEIIWICSGEGVVQRIDNSCFPSLLERSFSDMLKGKRLLCGEVSSLLSLVNAVFLKVLRGMR